MIRRYFLGANTSSGFQSLYGSFPNDEKAFLHVIKGGPGTGKSSFMRSIGKKAEALGLETEYVLCSGDPDSLDGVYIPELHEAWVDGTAPHISDPKYFGMCGDYVNLGQFCRIPFTEADSNNILHLTDEYREEYRRAYSFLAAASKLRQAAHPEMLGSNEQALIQKRVDKILSRKMSDLCKLSYVNRLFLSAVSCKGIIHLDQSILELCKLIYRFESEFDLDSFALKYAAEEIRRRGFPAVICPSPLDVDITDAVLLPCHSIALVSRDWNIDGAHTVQLDKYLSPEARRENRSVLRRTKQLYYSTAELAVERLKSAKALHDELETVYYKYMDFPALTEYTTEQVEKTFL